MLKQVQRPAKVSWGPVKQCSTLLAAGGVGVNFEKSQLEIYDANMGDTSTAMSLLGSVQTSDCFQSIAWGAKGIEDRALSHGIVAGGMSDGSINFWNVGAIIRRTESMLSRAAGHKSPVLDMSFHPAQVNLLASASASGEVFVWDIQNPTAPTFSNEHQQSGHVSSNAVCALDWNWKVHRILASANDIGETTIWDLRQKKGIISLKQQFSKHRGARQRDRATGLAWQPGREVNVAISYQSPVIELWDMRYATAPIKQLDGAHSSSVLGIDWCPHDPALLLSSGDDGRTFVWDALQGKVLSEYVSDGVNSDIDYSPFLPGVVSACNYDGMISLYSYNHTGPDHIPKWLGNPVGSSIGFGGKVVSFGLEQKPETTTPVDGKQPPAPSPTNASRSKRIHIDQIDSEPLLAQLSGQFIQQMQYGDWSTFCEQKIAGATDESERAEWKFMQILLADDKKSQCKQLVLELGFQLPQAEEEIKTDHHHQQQQQQQQQYQEQNPHHQQQGYHPDPPLSIHAPPDYNENDDSFFDNFVAPEQTIQPTTETKATTTGTAANEDGSDHGELVEALAASSANGKGEIDGDNEEDDVLRRALIVGDWKSAVARAIELDRIADALIFSSCAGLELWESTRALFFKKHTKPFVRNVVRLMVGHDLHTLVQESHLQKWKETLAILLTYSTGEERDGLVNALACRLEQQDTHAALLCYLCASNIDRVVSLWSRPAEKQQQQQGGAVVSLHRVIEKITVLAQATQAHSSPLLAAKYCEYAALLASQGCMPAAITFLSAAKADDECNAVLLDRLFRAQPPHYQNPAQAPPFPFHLRPIMVDPSQAHALAADAHQRQQAELQKLYPPQPEMSYEQQYQPQNVPQPFSNNPNIGQSRDIPRRSSIHNQSPGLQNQDNRRNSGVMQQEWQGSRVLPSRQPDFQHHPNPPYNPPAHGAPHHPGGTFTPDQNNYPPNPNNPYPPTPSGPFNPNVTGSRFPPKMLPPNAEFEHPIPSRPGPTLPPRPNPNPGPSAFPAPSRFPGPSAFPTPNPAENMSNLPGVRNPLPARLPPNTPLADPYSSMHPNNPNTSMTNFNNPALGPMNPPSMGSMNLPPLGSMNPSPMGSMNHPSASLPPHLTPSASNPHPTPAPPSHAGGFSRNVVPPLSHPSGAAHPGGSFAPSSGVTHPTGSFAPSSGVTHSTGNFVPSSVPPSVAPSPSRPPAQTQKVPLPHPRPVGPSAGGDGRAMAATLTRLADQLDQDPAVKPIDKKKLPEVRKRLADLTSRVEANALSPNALGLLNTLVQAMNDGNMLAAQQAHTKLVTDEFKDNQFWLPGVKTLMLMFKKK